MTPSFRAGGEPNDLSLCPLLQQKFLQLRSTARDARHHRAHRDLQRLRDFLVRIVFQVEHRQRRSKDLVHLLQCCDHCSPVHLIHRLGRDLRKFGFRFVQRLMRKPFPSSPYSQEFPIYRRKQP
jgi:hypothetical protein